MELEEAAKFLLNFAKEKGAQHFGVRLRQEVVKQIRFSNNQVDIVKTWIKEEGEIFASLEKRLGMSNLNSLERQSMEAAVLRAISSAKNSEPNEDFVGIYPGPFDEIKAGRYGDPDLMDDEKNVDAVMAGINAALEEGAKKVAGTLYSYEIKEALFTSEGAEYLLPPR